MPFFVIISPHEEGVSMDKKIFLTDEELNQLRYYANEVGHGSDGRVFHTRKIILSSYIEKH
jgi:hypothetical protein